MITLYIGEEKITLDSKRRWLERNADDLDRHFQQHNITDDIAADLHTEAEYLEYLMDALPDETSVLLALSDAITLIDNARLTLCGLTQNTLV